MLQKQRMEGTEESLDQQISDLAAQVDNLVSELPGPKKVAGLGDRQFGACERIAMNLNMARLRLEEAAEVAEGVEL